MNGTRDPPRTYINTTEGIFGAQPLNYYDRYYNRMYYANEGRKPVEHLQWGNLNRGRSASDLRRTDRDDSSRYEREFPKPKLLPSKAERGVSPAKSPLKETQKREARPYDKDKFDAFDRYEPLDRTTDSAKFDRRENPERTYERYYRPDRSLSPIYKPLGKSTTKDFSHKADLRFDVRDINQKKINVPYHQPDPRLEKKHLEYLKKQNLHLFDKYIPGEEIEKNVFYFEGQRVVKDPRDEVPKFHRSLSTKILTEEEFLRKNGFRNRVDHTTKTKEINEDLLKKEARFKFTIDPQIIRDEQVLRLREDARIPSSTKPVGKIQRAIK